MKSYCRKCGGLIIVGNVLTYMLLCGGMPVYKRAVQYGCKKCGRSWLQ